MPFVTIDVVPDRTGSRHYEVVIKRGNEVLAYWNVSTEEQGRSDILAAVDKINRQKNPDIS